MVRYTRLTCRQIVHLDSVSEDGPAAVSAGPHPVEVDAVGDTAARGFVALKVGQAHHGLARLARDVIERQPSVPFIPQLTPATAPGRAVPDGSVFSIVTCQLLLFFG